MTHNAVLMYAAQWSYITHADFWNRKSTVVTKNGYLCYNPSCSWKNRTLNANSYIEYSYHSLYLQTLVPCGDVKTPFIKTVITHCIDVTDLPQAVLMWWCTIHNSMQWASPMGLVESKEKGVFFPHFSMYSNSTVCSRTCRVTGTIATTVYFLFSSTLKNTDVGLRLAKSKNGLPPLK